MAGSGGNLSDRLQEIKILISSEETLKVSVITVVFDKKSFIADAINSVLHQTYPYIEYIVVDGGSRDGSLEIINSFGNRIHQVISEPDEGIYDAMNKGITLATGDVVGFLNADDFYTDKNVVKEMVEAFDDQTDAIYADIDYVALDNKEKIIRKWRSGVFDKSRLYNGWMPPHPTFFARKTIYEQFGGYNTSLKSSADYELMLRMILVHHISLTYIPRVLVKMRVGGQSNRSFGNRVKAHLEDRKVWKMLGLRPKWYTLWLKPLQKIKQYF